MWSMANLHQFCEREKREKETLEGKLSEVLAQQKKFQTEILSLVGDLWKEIREGREGSKVTPAAEPEKTETPGFIYDNIDQEEGRGGNHRNVLLEEDFWHEDEDDAMSSRISKVSNLALRSSSSTLRGTMTDVVGREPTIVGVDNGLNSFCAPLDVASTDRFSFTFGTKAPAVVRENTRAEEEESEVLPPPNKKRKLSDGIKDKRPPCYECEGCYEKETFESTCSTCTECCVWKEGKQYHLLNEDDPGYGKEGVKALEGWDNWLQYLIKNF
jgi:hypothetical protein